MATFIPGSSWSHGGMVGPWFKGGNPGALTAAYYARKRARARAQAALEKFKFKTTTFGVKMAAKIN